MQALRGCDPQRMQSLTVAAGEDRTITVPTSVVIIDLIAVADIEFLLSAKPPQRVLHKARKYCRIARIELACIDPLSKLAQDVCTTSILIAAGAIPMFPAKASNESCSVQKIVHESVNGNHANTSDQPSWLCPGSGHQHIRQRHVQSLMREAENVSQWLDQRVDSLCRAGVASKFCPR